MKTAKTRLIETEAAGRLRWNSGFTFASDHVRMYHLAIDENGKMGSAPRLHGNPLFPLPDKAEVNEYKEGRYMVFIASNWYYDFYTAAATPGNGQENER